MATVELHLETAYRAVAAFHAESSDFPDWCAVKLFYAALHFINALASSEDGPVPNDHHRREQWIRKKHKCGLWKNYTKLRDECDKARYMKKGQFSLSSEQVHEQLYKKRLLPIQRYVETKLGIDKETKKVVVPPQQASSIQSK